jgi:biopolymer transport protein ExbD
MAGRLKSEQDDESIDEQSDINITPFIDVMLVLLIIFMVAAPLSTVDIPVELPAASAEAKARPEKPVFVTIDARSTWAVGQTPVTAETLPSELERATSGKKDTMLFLRADKAVPYGDLMKLMDRLRTSGYTKVSLVGIEAPRGGTQ